MKPAVGAIAAITLTLALLLSSGFVCAMAQESQQGEILTATATSNTRDDAFGSAMNKAWYLCMLRGLNNITRLHCDCTQNDSRPGGGWECVGTAACKK
jgi:hypothetical protein